VKEERGKGYADLLIKAALRWAGDSYKEIFEKDRSMVEEERMVEWKGLVCAYARETAVKTWERNGFVVDEGMGSWFEVGIRHVGMLVRVPVVDRVA